MPTNATGVGDLHLNMPLTQFAISYRPKRLIADQIFPLVPVPKQADAYTIWSLADAYRISDARRAPGTEANKITRGVTSATFFCENRALKRAITLEDKANMDAAFVQNLYQNRAAHIMDDLALGWEQRVANLVTSGSNVGSYAGVSSGWSAKTTGKSDPIGDIWTAINNVEDSTGERPNRIIMGMEAWRNFRDHADVISHLWGTSGNGRSRTVRREQVAELFELDMFLVGESYYNSGGFGQDAVLSKLWGDDCLVYYAPDRPSIDSPSLGYTPRWRRPGIPELTAEIHPYNAVIKAEEVEVGYYQAEIITAANLGFLMTSCNSAS